MLHRVHQFICINVAQINVAAMILVSKTLAFPMNTNNLHGNCFSASSISLKHFWTSDGLLISEGGPNLNMSGKC